MTYTAKELAMIRDPQRRLYYIMKQSAEIYRNENERQRGKERRV